MTVKQVDKFSIMAVMSLITMKSFGCADIKMYEMEFIEMAKIPKVLLVLKHFIQMIFKQCYSDAEVITMLQESLMKIQKKVSSKLYSGKTFR
jgi:hypothetical protein